MELLPRRPSCGVALLGGILFALGTASSIALRKIYDTRPAYVNVRWAASVDDERRQQFERRYGLTRSEFRENRTWGYYLTDLSRTNIGALVGDPMVEDTHHIDRQAFRVSLRTARSHDVAAAPAIPPRYQLLSLSALVVGEIALAFSWIGNRLGAGGDDRVRETREQAERAG
jgi:hypothetical protein